MAEVTEASLTVIIKQGHWSQASTFQKFYGNYAKKYDSNFQSGIIIRLAGVYFTNWNLGLYKGTKRGNFNPKFTSEIVGNDLILPTRLFVLRNFENRSRGGGPGGRWHKN